MSEAMILPGDLDAALCDMIRASEAVIREWIGDDNQHFGIEDIDWDSSATPPEGAVDIDQLREVSHAIGFIRGVAAGLNVTPMTLLESYEDKSERGVLSAAALAVPPCWAGMKCLCAGHARGNKASEPCDTTETPSIRLVAAKPAKKSSRKKQRS